MRDLADFQTGQIVGARLAGASVNKPGISLGVSRASVSKGYDGILYHWKTSPAKMNSGRETKLSERDRYILKRVVSKNHRTAASTQYSSEDPVSTKIFRRELHKSSIYGRVAIAKPLITENKAKKRKRWCDDLET